MKYLVLAVALTVMQASPPVPRQTPDGTSGAGSSVQNQTKTDKAPAAQPQSPVNANPPEKHDARGRDQEARDTPKDINITKIPRVSVEPDWGAWIFSFLLVMVGFLQAWLLYRTWGEIERQADLMETGIEVAENNAKAAAENAKAARESVELLVNKERMRISVTVLPLELKPSDFGQLVECDVSFYGPTVAFIVEATSESEITPSKEPPTGAMWKLISLPPMIQPGSPAKRHRDILFHVTQFQIDSINNGASFLHFRGLIKYKDFMERDIRETSFCYTWRPAIPGAILPARWGKSGPPEANRET